MSATNREVAFRIFAAEYDDATLSYSESDEERAPNYVLTPTGARVNRVFFVGVLTAVERVSDDVLRGRIADPTGAFVVYAGQYQPDQMAFLDRADPPLFVAVTGKARTFSPEDSDRVFTSVRPESINEVDADTRDRWTVHTAEQTLARVATFRAAMDLGLAGDQLRSALLDGGVPEGLAAGIPRAMDHYGTTEHYLSAAADMAVGALELVADEADEVTPSSVAPGDTGPGTVDATTLASGVDGAVVDLEQVPSAPGSEAHTPESDSAGEGDAGDGDAGEADVAAGGEAASTEDEPDSTTEDEPDSTTTEDETEPDAVDADTGPTDAETEPDAEADADAVAADDADAVAADDAAATASEGAEDSSTDSSDGDLDDIGDFEPGGSTAGSEEADDADGSDEAEDADGSEDAAGDEGAEEPAASGAAGDETTEDVLDDEERERLEEEYGGFSTGTDVDEPGQAGIEPEAGPIETEEVAGDQSAGDDRADADAPTDDVDDVESDDGDESAEATTEAGEDDTGEETSDEPTEDIDLETAVLAAMSDLDDGDGAESEAVVAAVVDDHGVDPGAVEEAIEDALMAGKCYEPADDLVKPI